MKMLKLIVNLLKNIFGLLILWEYSPGYCEQGTFVPSNNQHPTKPNPFLKVRQFYDGVGGGIDCPAASECVPLIECSPIIYDIAKSCYYNDKSLFCNQNEDVPHVCCPSNPLERNQVCGRSLVQGQFYKGLGTYPFVARVGFKNVNTGNFAYPCTGSIISKRVVLTAAHCALAKADGHRLSSIRIGEYDTTTEPDCASSGFCAPRSVNHAISHVIVHPDYKHGQYHHDIALLILKTPMNYSVASQPICLQKSKINLVVGKRVTIAGWGKLSSSNYRSNEMVSLELPLAAWELCLRVYGSTGALESPNSVDGQWMCAGGEGKDVCQGFGGAPLFIQENGIYSQIGIMSFGSDNCGGARIPSVYTSISYYADWIQDNTPTE
ncbi:venom peptide isomerase heavy chain isoform X2 [Condylostylus longicornis]|uniref:venom peptide isomerase heavy chain isoform X2 n=1 Tax=Condylostylus longicornis TaxID=2530218 RepID=UPI00244DD5FF|nr:venom peptide isomerase heavy chain isoform X2 [Condylostylus longicornis]